jgi:hypothetical protein
MPKLGTNQPVQGGFIFKSTLKFPYDALTLASRKPILMHDAGRAPFVRGDH